MKKLFSLLIAVLMVSMTFAFTNVTEEELSWIIKETNEIIKNEIVIESPKTETGSQKTWDVVSTWDSKLTGDCNIEKPCENEMELAITKLNKVGATKFSTPRDFMIWKNIRRDEAAKMYLKFLEWANKLPAKQNWLSCKFTDLDKAWQDIVPMIGKVCEYWFFKGSQWKFMPLDNITNWQAVIVLIRAIDGKKEEINWVSHYAENYVKKANELWILEWLNITDMKSREMPISRWNVAKLLYRASNLKLK